MALLGKYNTLRVIKASAPGFYLDGGELGEILLPGQYIPQGMLPGRSMEVFVYRDSEDRLVATTETPYATVGEFAFLRVVSCNPRLGAFLDWGLGKDLLLPNREQEHRVAPGNWVVAYVRLDEVSNRIVATTRLKRHLNLTAPTYSEGQKVGLMIAGETPLGYNAIVEGAHLGLLYKSELSGPLHAGEKMDGYIRTVRPDGKIDLGLDRTGYRRVAPLTEQILGALAAAKGRLPFDDDSPPEEIRTAFGCSKKAFKQAIGLLYKQRRILIEKPGIRLADPRAKP